MNYLGLAFGTFEPHIERDAAVKFVLNVLLKDGRLEELAEVAKDDCWLGELGGEPAWLLTRRDLTDGPEGFEGWPTNASIRFRAFVDPDEGYTLAHPEYFMDRETFNRYVRMAMTGYIRGNGPLAASEWVAELLALTADGKPAGH